MLHSIDHGLRMRTYSISWCIITLVFISAVNSRHRPQNALLVTRIVDRTERLLMHSTVWSRPKNMGRSAQLIIWTGQKREGGRRWIWSDHLVCLRGRPSQQRIWVGKKRGGQTVILLWAAHILRCGAYCTCLQTVQVCSECRVTVHSWIYSSPDKKWSPFYIILLRYQKRTQLHNRLTAPSENVWHKHFPLN